MHKNAIKYINENTGSFFIIVFMVLLIFCAFLTALKKEGFAEKTAILAYFFLVIGVIIKILRSGKQGLL